jgi:alpha-glucosidase
LKEAKTVRHRTGFFFYRHWQNITIVHPDKYVYISDKLTTMKQKSLYLLLIAASLLFSRPIAAETASSIGNLKSFKQEGNKISIQTDNATMEITAYQNNIIRVRAFRNAPPRTFSFAIDQQAKGSFTNVTEDGSKLTALTSDVKVEITKSPLRISFYDKNGKLLNADDPRFGITWLGTDVTCYKKLFNDEKFIGLGEKTGPLNKRSLSYENWNSDVPAYALDKDPLYATIPFYIGIHDGLPYGIFFDNTHRSTFSFGASTDGEMAHFGAVDGEMDYYFFAGNSVRDIIEGYTWLTGRPKLPPLWSLGYQQCRYSYYPDKEVLNVAQTFRDKQFPCDVIYLDIHYMDNYKVFTWNPERFPEPKKMIDELKSKGFHLAVIIDPGLKIEKGYKSYDDALQHNYFLAYPNGQPYIGSVWPGRSSFPDFTRGEVRKWWGEQFSSLTGKGVEGFWNDMNEPATWGQRIPDMVEFGFEGNKTSIREGHNVFGMQMARGTYEGTRKLMDGHRPLTITRATYSGGQRYSTIWTGDNFASDDHMLLGARLVANLGLAGFAFAGPDVGGFIGEPSKELLTRWMSLGAFTPFYRNHSAVDQNYREPWVLPKDNQDIVRNYLNLRYQLMPYIYSNALVASRTGLPLVRTLAIDFTNDDNIYKTTYDSQYMFGDGLLVCPARSTDQFTRVYLPEGTWYRFSNDEKYAGGKEYFVASPLNDLPVFAREGAIIPMQNTVQNTSENAGDTLKIHIFNGSKATDFLYYEDDGVTYNYEKGTSYERTIHFDPAKAEISISDRKGDFASRFKKIRLILHGFDTTVHNATYDWKDAAFSIKLKPTKQK